MFSNAIHALSQAVTGSVCCLGADYISTGVLHMAVRPPDHQVSNIQYSLQAQPIQDCKVR